MFQKEVETTYPLYRVLQGVEWHPMEPHRAPLGGKGHVVSRGQTQPPTGRGQIRLHQ